MQKLVYYNVLKIGANTIDLEGIAKHKGSLLGSNPNVSQPSQKLLKVKLY